MYSVGFLYGIIVPFISYFWIRSFKIELIIIYSMEQRLKQNSKSNNQILEIPEDE